MYISFVIFIILPYEKNMKNYKATIICVLATIVQLCDILTQIELYLNQLTSTQVLFIHISLPGMPASD
jgi:hypothetical protein